jgi:hypothetical protein
MHNTFAKQLFTPQKIWALFGRHFLLLYTFHRPCIAKIQKIDSGYVFLKAFRKNYFVPHKNHWLYTDLSTEEKIVYPFKILPD